MLGRSDHSQKLLLGFWEIGLFLETMPSRKPLRSKKIKTKPKPSGWDKRKEAGWDPRFIRGRIESDDRKGNVSVSLRF